MSTRVPIGLPQDQDLEIPTADQHVDLIGPRLVYQYHTRDNEQSPSRGIYATATLQWDLSG